MTDPHTSATAPSPQSTDDALPFAPGDHWADHVADYNSVTFRPHPDFTGWDEVAPIDSAGEEFDGEDEVGGGVPLHHVSHGPPPRAGEENAAKPLHQPAAGPPPLDKLGEEQALTCTRAVPWQATSRTAFQTALPDDDDPLLAFVPYLHKAPRSNSITPDKQRAFVAQLAATGIVSQAARHIGKSMEALYKLRHRSGAEGFAAAWDAAIERGVTRLEDCALERAMQGTPTPIVGREGILGWWDKPDNSLLRFLLQYRLSGKYGVQQIKPGHPIYESIRKEVLDEYENRPENSESAVFASIRRKIDAIRRMQAAADAAKAAGEPEPPEDFDYYLANPEA